MGRYAIKDIKGVIPALVTSFDEKGEFDEARQRSVVRFLLSRGADGLYLTGSTGEFFMMAPQERERVVAAVADEVAGRVPVIVHVGAVGTKLSVDLARQAQSCGADAISSVPPFYWKFTNDEILDYYREIGESVGLPMIVYNIALSGLVGYGLIKRLAKLPGVQGIKYTATSHFEIGRIKEEIGEDFAVYSGADEMAMSGLAVGADGVIGSFYNMIPELFKDIYAAVRRGDLAAAREKQAQANAVIFYSLDHNYIPVIKRSLSWAGVDAGRCRKPLPYHSEAEAAEIRAALARIRDERGIEGCAVLDAL
ncbi:MAG TPA: dihydrodipicolinate synthase family protein [Spirochaetales bacterium]|nr:dihydrodipicolinate synthase family protein [Spirochaetales bacterium]HRY55770.1 dihydrodipicolinate synthase family protein [Spirochaetia bacterium]HRZ63349.1 dihydrodipicolinate synthase family protein [Spirochaetia bacterium]